MPTDTKHHAKQEEAPKREFAFSQEFPNEIEVALRAFDQVFKELTSISNGKITFDEEYGVVNNLYKLRYITPNDIATFTSNLIKVLRNHMICPHVDDLQKFAVVCAKQFIEDHGCTPIEHSSIYGSMRYATDNMTLRDLLVLVENDFYHTTVVSKFEMQERVKVMKKDYTKISEMHYATNTMKIVESLPKLITNTDFNELTYVEQKAVQEFIEEFIIFATMLNTIVMSNMIFFCVPKSTYDTRLIAKKESIESNDLLDESDIEDHPLITESVDLSKSKPIYIVLMSGNGAISKAVQKKTKSSISHSGISFDPSMKRIYSFGMGNQHTSEDAPNKNGFRIDSFFTDNHKDVTMSVYVGYVSNENYQKMKDFVEKTYVGNKDTKYHLGTIWKQLWNSDKENKNQKETAMVCSTFVDKVLKVASIDVTGKHLPSPHDLDNSMAGDMTKFERVFHGTPDHFNEEDMLDRVKNFAKYAKSKNMDFVGESMDLTKSKPIYILLCEGDVWISKKIKEHTRSKFSHIGISLDPSMKHVHSYAMANEITEESKNKNGYCIEDYSSDKKKHLPITVYVGFVTNDQFEDIQAFISQYKNAKTKYSIGMIGHQLFNDDKARRNPDKLMFEQVCSTFVDTVLKHAKINVTGKNRPSPSDFEKSMSSKIGQFRMIFSGPYENYNMDLIIKRTNAFAKDEESQPINKNKVVTECCLLKTNQARHTSKIPFDINMRNIVLQDMHPKFKDTVAAIDYITHDTRSPIAQLIFRYGHPSEVLNGMDGMYICKMFINDPCARCGSYDEYTNQLHQVDFHTDVCWLDRIAYGNNFLDSNYRDDALGNEHKHPIKQTLETLYHMFGETHLKTKEELCNHILKISHIMKGIIECYGSNGLYNWEMVRDILAVLGEIMTRSMIKLYDSHMQIIASDNMDDVDAPGYMYVEAGTQLPMRVNKNQDVWIQEKANIKTNENKENPPSTDSQGSEEQNESQSKIKRVVIAVIKWCKEMLQRFVNWVKNILEKLGFRFKQKVEAVHALLEKNKELNTNIGKAIHAGSFKPNISEFTKYNFANQLVDEDLSQILKDIRQYSKKDEVVTVDSIKKRYYSDGLRAKLSEIANTSESYCDHIITSQIFQEFENLEDVEAIYVKFAIDTPKRNTLSKYLNIKTISDFNSENKDIKDDLAKAKTDLIHSAIMNITNSKLFHAELALRPDLGKRIAATTDVQKNGALMAYDLPDSDNKYCIVVYAAFVPKETYQKLTDRYNYIKAHKEDTSYSKKQAIARIFNLDINGADDLSRHCSSITNDLLKLAGVTVNPIWKNNPGPGDLNKSILKRDDFHLIYIGPENRYNSNTAFSIVETLASFETTKYASDEKPQPIKKPNRRKLTDDQKKVQDYILFNDAQNKTINALNYESWNNSVVGVLKDCVDTLDQVEKMTKDANEIIPMLQDEIKRIDEAKDALINNAPAISRAGDLGELPVDLDFQSKKTKIELQAVLSIKNEFLSLVTISYEDAMQEIVYVYKAIVNQYMKYAKKNKTVSESYIETTLDELSRYEEIICA